MAGYPSYSLFVEAESCLFHGLLKSSCRLSYSFQSKAGLQSESFCGCRVKLSKMLWRGDNELPGRCVHAALILWLACGKERRLQTETINSNDSILKRKGYK
jgi:hypothetical protein